MRGKKESSGKNRNLKLNKRNTQHDIHLVCTQDSESHPEMMLKGRHDRTFIWCTDKTVNCNQK